MIWNEKCSQVSCKTGALIKANTSAERYKFLQIAQQHQKWKKHGSTCLQCNQIYCRGQTKAEDLMLSLAQLFQGFKLQCNFFCSISITKTKVASCHVNPVSVRSDLPQVSVSWGEEGVVLSLQRVVCCRSQLQRLPRSQTLRACCCLVAAGCWAFLDAAQEFVLLPWGIQLCQ